MKDTWKKPKGDRMEGGRWGYVEQGKMVARKWRQVYLNNNFYKFLKKKYSKS